MKTYPARFVGEFAFEFRNVAWEPSDGSAIGDVAIVHGYPDGRDRAYIRCACGDVDVIPISGASSWQIVSREPVHLEPSIRVTSGGPTICHYFVHGGQLQMLDDTTAILR